MSIKRFGVCIGLLLIVTTLVVVPNQAPVQALQRHGIPVLMYHYVSDPPDLSDMARVTLSVTPAHFQEQMKWLKDNGYVTINPEQLIGANPPPAHAVLLTFDDGYADAYTNVFPALKSYGFVGTFFIVTDWVDQARPGYVTWDQIRQMATAGMSIEAHTRTHEAMAGHNDAWLKNEIVGSLDAIEKNLGTRPRFFAYPFGSYDRAVIRNLTAAGIAAAFTTRNGTIYSVRGRALVLPRLRMRYNTNLIDFGSLVLRTTS